MTHSFRTVNGISTVAIETEHGSQSIVDSDKSNYFTEYGMAIIADHVNQDFAKLHECEVGTLGTLDGKPIICTRKEFGYNYPGSWLQHDDSSKYTALDNADLLTYTCSGNGDYRIWLLEWRYIDMTIPEKAALYMEQLAADDSHGYSQDNRWGVDYDCSSAVIQMYEDAGAPVKTAGATYTGNMRDVFLRCGFTDVTDMVNLANGDGMKRGDVLLNEVHHTAMYLGDGMIAHASANENGGAHGGKPGDQTGKEICKRTYYNYPWDCVLRHKDAFDIGAPSEWARESCVKAVKAGIFHGDGDGNFRWKDGITREEMAVVLDNVGLLV